VLGFRFGVAAMLLSLLKLMGEQFAWVQAVGITLIILEFGGRMSLDTIIMLLYQEE